MSSRILFWLPFSRHSIQWCFYSASAHIVSPFTFLLINLPTSVLDQPVFSLSTQHAASTTALISSSPPHSRSLPSITHCCQARRHETHNSFLSLICCRFVHPDGTVHLMTYTAGVNGFQPISDLLPTPHPLEPWHLEQVILTVLAMRYIWWI